MERLHQQMDDLTNIDKHIVDQLTTFAGTIHTFATTVLNLSTTVASLSTEVKYLREDINETKEIKKDIITIQNTLASNKGGWVVATAIGGSVLSVSALVIAGVGLFMKH